MDATGEPIAATAVTALNRLVVEVEQHVAAEGWDAPLRLFALVRTADALQRDPALARRLPPDVVAAADADPHHLTAVEQEQLPEVESLEDLLGRIAWPETVDGAAVVVERSVLPPSAEAALPDDESAALTWVQSHPEREDVRLAAAVLRGGERSVALRSRRHDDDDKVAVGVDLAPGLTTALAATFA